MVEAEGVGLLALRLTGSYIGDGGFECRRRAFTRSVRLSWILCGFRGVVRGCAPLGLCFPSRCGL